MQSCMVHIAERSLDFLRQSTFFLLDSLALNKRSHIPTSMPECLAALVLPFNHIKLIFTYAQTYFCRITRSGRDLDIQVVQLTVQHGDLHTVLEKLLSNLFWRAPVFQRAGYSNAYLALIDSNLFDTDSFPKSNTEPWHEIWCVILCYWHKWGQVVSK